MGAVGVKESWEYRSDVIAHDTIACKSACVCVCVWERERERVEIRTEGGIERGGLTHTEIHHHYPPPPFPVSIVDKCCVNFARSKCEVMSVMSLL